MLYLSHQKTNLEKDIWSSGFEGLERNFSGLELDGKNSEAIIKDIYINNIPKHIKYNFLNKKVDLVKLIQDNIDEPKSRYLLIISKPSVSCHLLMKILKDKNFNIFIGSKFKNDLNSEEYHYKLINKIQICMDEGGIVVLKDLDNIYPALYDLLNQNFTIVSNKNFARISIGVSNTYYFVNDNFKCIIIVDNDKIQEQETPFLNRFEKHNANFDELLPNELNVEANNLYNDLKKIINQIENYKLINYDLKSIIINFNLEEIKGLIYQANEKGIKPQNMKEEFFSKFALTFPQDIIIFLKHIQFENKDLIFNSYIKGEHRSLSQFLNIMITRKNIVYTFSTVLDTIRNLKIKNENLKLNIEEENIKKIKLRGIKSEKHFERELNDFLKKDRYKVCLLHFTSQEEKFFDFIKFFIDNKEKEQGIKQKIYIFIVHMNRIFKDKKNFYEKKEIKNLNDEFSFLSGYYQIFIDNLNGEEKIDLLKIIKCNDEDLIDNCIDFNNEIKNNIFKTITYMKYNIFFSLGDLNKDNYTEKLKSFIQNDKNKIIRKLINNCIKKRLIKNNVIENIYEQKADSDKVENNSELILTVSQYDLDIIGLIKKYILKLYVSSFGYFIFLAENDNFFSSILCLNILFPDFSSYFNQIKKNLKK